MARFGVTRLGVTRFGILGLAAVMAAALAATAQAQTPPPFATTKVDGTENVYIFRFGGHQSMFVVTPAGVIATDPISLRRPAAKAYIEEIEKITKAPIRYVIYSHSHFDHIAGGKPFKDKGAVFVAHQNARARILQVKDPDVVVPDQMVTGTKRNITLGGTTLELNYVGKNHSDSTLVMRLPKEKIIFTVDWIPLNGVQFRGMADNYLPDIEDGLIVDDLIGVGQGNVIGGGFSHPVGLAYRVQRGEITGRVKDAAVAGNVYDLLKSIAGFGSDGRWLGSRWWPSVRLDGVSVARR